MGLILLFAAAGLAHGVEPVRSLAAGLAAIGTIVIGLVAALTVVQLFRVQLGISQLILIGLGFVILLVIPLCAWLDPTFRGTWVDKVLWIYWAGEMALALCLWRLSTGAWFNYALEAVVIACVLTARALERAVSGSARARSLAAICLAAVAVPAFAFTDVNQVLAKRRAESDGLARLLEKVPARPSEIFFVDQPGANRLHGRRDLVYDPWLYPVFESIGLAEPRSIWLEQALSTGGRCASLPRRSNRPRG